MSFVGEPYPIDVFISYSHGDITGGGDSPLLEWSRRFQKAFEAELRTQIGPEACSIFYDTNPRRSEGLDPHAPFDKELKKKAKGSAIFLALVSHFFIDSDWCRRELNWWRKAQAERNLPADERIALARIWGRPPRRYPDWEKALEEIKLPNRAGRYFYERGTDAKGPQPFGWLGGVDSAEDLKLRRSICELAGDVYDMLDKFYKLARERQMAAAAAPAYGDGGKPSIYLHGRDDARSQWDQAADQLSASGFPVRPEAPEPIETDLTKRSKVHESRIQTLSTCDALLMLAPEDTAIFSEELMVLGKADRTLAIDRAQQQLDQRSKKLPGAVIDTITDPDRVRRRRDQVRNLRLEWFSLADPNWVNETDGWLRSSLG